MLRLLWEGLFSYLRKQVNQPVMPATSNPASHVSIHTAWPCWNTSCANCLQFGCGSKPMVPFWGRPAIVVYFSGDWDVHWGYTHCHLLLPIRVGKALFREVFVMTHVGFPPVTVPVLERVEPVLYGAEMPPPSSSELPATGRSGVTGRGLAQFREPSGKPSQPANQPKGNPKLLNSLQLTNMGCCWETFYIFASCG